MRKIAPLALLGGAALALAACGSSESASTEATADTVEMPADDALESVSEEPAEDTAANEGPPQGDGGDAEPPAPVTREVAETAADRAADVAAQAEAAAEAADAAADAAAAAAAIEE